MKRFVWIFAAFLLVGAVAWDFAVATTFLGDDYLFRAFARLEGNPLVAFTTDKHGGEYYRPLPMVLWWLLERLTDGRAWCFALVAFLLHTACAGLVAVVARRMGLSRRTALVSGCLFFASPAQREAALWFSASTDLLSTVAMVAAVVCLLSDKKWARGLSIPWAAVAFLCKESALVLPALMVAAIWFRARNQGESPRAGRCLAVVLPHLVVAMVVLVARGLVLGGIGGAGDPLAPWWGRAVQLASGLVHSMTAYAPLPEWVAWLVGACVIGWAVFVTSRRKALSVFALAWVAISLAPLPAAGWVVGARYFYGPAVGLMILLALALETAGGLASVFAVAIFLGLGLPAGRHRAAEVRLYQRAVAAARAGVEAEVSRGNRLFFVSGGVKDLDLALKLDRHASQAMRQAVVVPDVPASFVWMPPDLAGRLDFLLARPPLPPSGAYHFGDAKLVGLARREEAPDLDDVLERLPDLRILRLVFQAGGFHIEDRTEQYMRGRD